MTDLIQEMTDLFNSENYSQMDSVVPEQMKKLLTIYSRSDLDTLTTELYEGYLAIDSAESCILRAVLIQIQPDIHKLIQLVKQLTESQSEIPSDLTELTRQI